MIIEILLIAVSVSMDAFAVAIGKGLTVTHKVRWQDATKVGLWFGGFQALFPVLGFLAASTFSQYVTAVDHWIIFALLVFIGGNMIREAIFEDDEEDAKETPDFDWKHMLPLAIATSIDAFAVGVSFAFMPINIVLAVVLIGLTTGLFSVAGVYIGHFFGARWAEARADRRRRGARAHRHQGAAGARGPDRVLIRAPERTARNIRHVFTPRIGPETYRMFRAAY